VTPEIGPLPEQTVSYSDSSFQMGPGPLTAGGGAVGVVEPLPGAGLELGGGRLQGRIRRLVHRPMWVGLGSMILTLLVGGSIGAARHPWGEVAARPSRVDALERALAPMPEQALAPMPGRDVAPMPERALAPMPGREDGAVRGAVGGASQVDLSMRSGADGGAQALNARLLPETSPTTKTQARAPAGRTADRQDSASSVAARKGRDGAGGAPPSPSRRGAEAESGPAGAGKSSSSAPAGDGEDGDGAGKGKGGDPTPPPIPIGKGAGGSKSSDVIEPRAPSPGFGRVILGSVPFAKIRIDGRDVADEPILEPVRLPAGSHEVRMLSERGQEATFDIQVEAGRTIQYRWLFGTSRLERKEPRY
jgi:hypothetical protein